MTPRLYCLPLHCELSVEACKRVYVARHVACRGCGTGAANDATPLRLAYGAQAGGGRVQFAPGGSREALIEKQQRMRTETAGHVMTERRVRALAEARKRASARRRQDVRVGARYGAWTVVACAGGYGRVRVIARCDCGVERQHLLSTLRTGRSRACPGCASRARRKRYADAAE